MKSLASLITVFIISIFNSSGQNVPPAPEDKAVIYFVCPRGLGFAINFTYFDNSQFVGKFNGMKYIRYECKPGKHIFWARSENRDFIEAEVEAGKIYFIKAIPVTGVVKAAVRLQAINPKNPKEMKSIWKLINKKASVHYTEEELERETKEMEKVIERGLEKYYTEKGAGQPFNQLDRNMYL